MTLDENTVELSCDEDTLNNLFVNTNSKADCVEKLKANQGKSLQNDHQVWATKYSANSKTLSSLLVVLN